MGTLIKVLKVALYLGISAALAAMVQYLQGVQVFVPWTLILINIVIYVLKQIIKYIPKNEE